VNVSPTLLKYQWHNISTMALGAVYAFNPLKKKGFRPCVEQLDAPADNLVDAFASWINAPATRYKHQVPAALITSQAALAIIAKLTMQAPYPMLNVLNQGVRISFNAPIPRGEALHLSGELLDASDDGYRARVHGRVHVSTSSTANALVIESIAAVPLKPRPKTNEAPKVRRSDWTTISTWQADANEGRRFFYLTGDFNPIHTLPLVARNTRFKGCIMHGYGSVSQIIEALLNHGIRLSVIDLRFICPVALPSPELLIQIAESANDDGSWDVRLSDHAGQVYQAGYFISAN